MTGDYFNTICFIGSNVIAGGQGQKGFALVFDARFLTLMRIPAFSKRAIHKTVVFNAKSVVFSVVLRFLGGSSFRSLLSHS